MPQNVERAVVVIRRVSYRALQQVSHLFSVFHVSTPTFSLQLLILILFHQERRLHPSMGTSTHHLVSSIDRVIMALKSNIQQASFSPLI